MPLADDEIPITSYGTGSDKEAAVTVWIRRSEDNYAAPEQIGYRVEIVSGNAPAASPARRRWSSTETGSSSPLTTGTTTT